MLYPIPDSKPLIWILLFCFTFGALRAQPGTGNQGTDPVHRFVVVLDPGHGGADMGARGSFSVEKNVTLAIALKLGKLLKETQPDVHVIFTRTTDTYPPLYERTAIANRDNANLFISIHCNSSPYHRILIGHRYIRRRGRRIRIPVYRLIHVTDAMGTETYVMGLHRNGEKERAIEDNLNGSDSNDVESQENAYIFKEKDYQKHYAEFNPTNPESNIMVSLQSSSYLDQSIAFADSIQQQVLRIGRPSREVRQKDLEVLAGTAMPAVLVETGFINNPTEERYLNSTFGQEQIATCIAKAIQQYKLAFWKLNSLDQPSGGTDTEQTTLTGKGNMDPTQYRIQLLVSATRYASGSSLFRNLDTPVKVVPIGNKKMFRYFTGNYYSRDSADEALNRIRLIGFRDAFLVPLQSAGQAAN